MPRYQLPITACVNLYRVGIGAPTPAGVPHPAGRNPSPLVMESPQPLPGFDVLIGMDLLATARLFIDGPGRTFTLDF